MNLIPKENLVVYDLSQSPITFDFALFLAYARVELAKKSQSLDFFLHISADKWRNITPREKKYTLKERLWRLHNLLIPMCGLSPNVLGYSVFLDDRWRQGEAISEHAICCEENNDMTRFLVRAVSEGGIEPHLFKAPEVALNYADRILAGSTRPIVVAVRESSFERARNISGEFIRKLSQQLADAGHDVFIIPDQETRSFGTAANPSAKILHEAAYNLPLRLALHEKAAVSICSSGGPMILTSLAVTKPSFVVINPVVPGVRVASPEFLSSQGYDVGNVQPFSWTPSNQTWLWDPPVSTQPVLEATLSLT